MEGMRSSGIANIFLAEVVFHPLGPLLDTAQGADGGARERHLGSCWSGLGYALLQVGVQQFVRVQFRRVALQIRHCNLVFVFKEPFLHRPGVMHAQVVENEKNPRLAPMHESLQKADQKTWRSALPQTTSFHRRYPCLIRHRNSAVASCRISRTRVGTSAF